MSVSGRKVAIQKAFEAGVRRCPCCDVQLVWRGKNGIMHPRNLATVDHIIPRCFGGSDHYLNLFVMCVTCNNKRDTTCFIDFVTKNGVCNIKAKEAYDAALEVTIRQMLYGAILGQKPKNLKKNLEKVSQMAADFHGGSLPERFKILPLSRKYKVCPV